MNVIDGVSSPGGRKPNEDRLGHSDCLGWVLDGATDLETDTVLPAGSDVQWLVDRVDAHLGEVRPAALRAGLDALLWGVSRRIGAELRALRFPGERIHPTCSVGLAARDGSTLRLARVGDPTCLALGEDCVELSTGFFGRQESLAVRRARNGGLQRADVRDGIVERRRRYIEGTLDESVFSGHPRAGLKISSAALDASAAEYVLLCSDGFARAVVDYGIYADWDSLVRSALRDGLGSILAEIRSYESERAGGPDHDAAAAHFKASDDATALLMAV